MKKRIIRITAAILMLLMLLSSCGPAAVPGEDVSSDVQSTEAPTTEADTAVYIERPDKEVKKILMIGNSFCYYFTDELYGIASADGYDLTVANLYKSGCLVSEHWMSGVMKAKNESTYKDSKIYKLYTVTNKGRKEVAAPNFDEALAYDDWDVITLQQHFYPTMAKDYDKCISDTKLYAGKLFDHVKENNPEATLYWHETWAYQVGFDSKGETITELNLRLKLVLGEFYSDVISDSIKVIEAILYGGVIPTEEQIEMLSKAHKVLEKELKMRNNTVAYIFKRRFLLPIFNFSIKRKSKN